jgi:hypothetical protein
MATTTNYSWTTPDDTDLVKDGAAAIRSLGTAIDSTVFTNAGAAIAKTIVDAKGDIIAATAADTVSRLAVGTNDHVLTADSSTATGLKWALPSAGGYTQLATGTLSGSSTSISSIPSTYQHLVLYVYDYTTTASGTYFFRVNANSTGIYRSTGVVAEDSAGVSLFNNGGGNQEYFTGYAMSTTTDMATTILIYDYANTAAPKNFHMIGTTRDGSGNNRYILKNSAGTLATNSAVSSIEIHTDSSTFSAGTYYLFGVK